MSAFTEEFVEAVAAGIREFNADQLPTRLLLVDGEILDSRTQAECDARWLDAVRYGLTKAAAKVTS